MLFTAAVTGEKGTNGIHSFAVDIEPEDAIKYLRWIWKVAELQQENEAVFRLEIFEDNGDWLSYNDLIDSYISLDGSPVPVDGDEAEEVVRFVAPRTMEGRTIQVYATGITFTAEAYQTGITVVTQEFPRDLLQWVLDTENRIEAFCAGEATLFEKRNRLE